jgi:hypothetical protein
MATEPGQDALEVYKVDIRSTGTHFRQVGAELASTEHVAVQVLLVVDTIDNLAPLVRRRRRRRPGQSAGFDPKKLPPRLRLRLRQGLGRHRAGVPSARRPSSATSVSA